MVYTTSSFPMNIMDRIRMRATGVSQRVQRRVSARSSTGELVCPLPWPVPEVSAQLDRAKGLFSDSSRD